MIDEEWLKSLDFVGEQGLHFRGLAGVGADDVVLIAYAPDGEKLAIKARRHHLGFHINEIPLFLSPSPKYDVNRVNRKLLKLVGNDGLDEMTAEYDRLFAALLKAVHDVDQGGQAEQVKSLIPQIGLRMTPTCPEAWPFLFRTRMMRRRLDEIATMQSASTGSLNSLFADVNGSNFKISGMSSQLASWAQRLLRACEQLPSVASFSPETLSHNPVFVWGAAVMDGFFTDAELPQVVSFIEAKFGRLPSHPDVDRFFNQIDAIATALTCLEDSEVERFVKLCGLLGFMFDVHDNHGRVVASSMHLADNV